MTDVVTSLPPDACEASTAWAERCYLRAVHDVDVPDLGPRRLCGIHARYVRAHSRLPEPRVPVRPRWTAAEDAVVRTHAGEPVAVSASLLDRTPWAIYARRKTLRRDGGWVGRHNLPWSPDEDRVLRDHPDLPARELAARLGRTTAAVNQRRAALRREGRA